MERVKCMNECMTCHCFAFLTVKKQGSGTEILTHIMSMSHIGFTVASMFPVLTFSRKID